MLCPPSRTRCAMTRAVFPETPIMRCDCRLKTLLAGEDSRYMAIIHLRSGIPERYAGVLVQAGKFIGPAFQRRLQGSGHCVTLGQVPPERRPQEIRIPDSGYEAKRTMSLNRRLTREVAAPGPLRGGTRPPPGGWPTTSSRRAAGRRPRASPRPRGR